MVDSKTTTYAPRLKKEFNDTYKAELKKELGLANVNAVPSLEKIVINIGLGKSKDDKRMFEVATNTLEKITGQKPIMTYSKVNIATFKLREGNKIGMKVTLRGDRMYEFLDRLVNIVLPRLRDFHGVSNKAFDKQGNYSIGITEQSIFPELSFEETTTAHGLQVVIVTKADNKEHAQALLVKLGVPFKKEGK
ncbi:MAG: 50S ribosomal protein L5 [Patescibacteria group bacterium]